LAVLPLGWRLLVTRIELLFSNFIVRSPAAMRTA